MRLSFRSKGGIVASLITILVLVGALALTLVLNTSTSTRAASVNRIKGIPSTITKISSKTYDINASSSGKGNQRPPQSSETEDAVTKHSKANGNGAPLADDLTIDPVTATVDAVSPNASPDSSRGKILHNFRGLDSVDSQNANGFILEPPDQGLCIGTLGGKKVVIEIINDVVAAYSPDGHLVGGIQNLNDFFGEDFNTTSVTDPRCYYDAASHGFFFLALILDFPNVIPNHIDVLFLRSDFAVREIAFDVTFANNMAGLCPCIGDQPKLGIDKQNLYVSMDQFGNPPGFNAETGAAVVALSKSQLISGATVHTTTFLNLKFLGAPVLGLVPAITNGNTPVEYMMNAQIFDKNGNVITLSHTLGLWALAHPERVATGGTVELTVTAITSEQYAQPVPALTTNGAALDTDHRMQKVQFINGKLLATLDTAVTVKGDPNTRDGIAFFELKPKLSGDDIAGAQFVSQGYIAAKGKFLVMPSIDQNVDGTTVIGFSFTSETIHPSTAFVIRGPGKFRAIRVTANGAGPDLGFTCASGICRWGDYSTVELDPDGHNFWVADEYIVGRVATHTVQGVDFHTNWGTRITQVDGN